MNDVLGSLLAGVRNARTPLAAGYLWLVAFYLAESSSVRRPPAGSVLDDLHALVLDLPQGILVAASAFVAYLLGATSLDIGEALASRVARIAPRFVPALNTWAGYRDAALSLRGKLAVEKLCRSQVRAIQRDVRVANVAAEALRFRAKEGERTPPSPNAAMIVADIAKAQEEGREHESSDPMTTITDAVIDDIEATKLRLLTKEPVLYAEIDRADAESAIRLAIIPPLGTLSVVLTVRYHCAWWLLGGIVVLVILLHQAIQRRKLRGDLIVDGLTLGHCRAPFLEQLEAEAADLLADVERDSG